MTNGKTRAVMVLGTTSGAGKSWLATALCRWYARQGLKVMPFKAQNMSNNARVVAKEGGGWGEIGAAQYLQALAAHARPHVRMNPVLLKPEGDMRSQVIVLGEVDKVLSEAPWRGRSVRLWPVVRQALTELSQEADLIVIEGAGSPAEINLQTDDIVNLRVAREADARCLLVSDIDRGGAFAHLFGTWALLPPEDRGRLAGFVLNRFRGDASLLSPGPERLEELTGVPTVAVLPMWREHGLPEEDGVYDHGHARAGDGSRVVAIVAYPHISNLDEFEPLLALPGVRVVWAHGPQELAGADWVILPGSKRTASDLAWLRGAGMAPAIVAHVKRGGRLLGICGGLQMLGERLVDPLGVDGAGPGLGWLPLETHFEPHKTIHPRQATFTEMPGAWAPLSGLTAFGYEIHQGHTKPMPGTSAQAVFSGGDELGWCSADGQVLGVYLHGLFENPAILRALFGDAAVSVRSLDTVFDGLADFIDQHFAPGALRQLAGL